MEKAAEDLIKAAKEWRSYQYPLDEADTEETVRFVRLRRFQTRLALIKAIDEFVDSKAADSLYKNGIPPLTGE